MYKEHFGLKELPFSIAPDPRYLYLSEKHREALAHLIFGVKSAGGFVLLTGEVGTGKTTVSRCLLEKIPENADIAYIINPKMTVEELLATFCDELGIRYPEGNKSIKVFVDNINIYLLDSFSRGRKPVLIIEEAQNLSPDVLEQVRLLTNLETNQQKLLQIIMIGQPELREMLSRPDMLQLSQRITARYHLGPLSKEEVGAYVNHRLSVGGVTRKLFPDLIISKLYHLSRGIPRLINIICDRALLGAYVQGMDNVDKRTLVKAAKEISGEEMIRKGISNLRWAPTVIVMIICAALLAVAFYNSKTIISAISDNNKRAGKSTEKNILNTLEWSAGQSVQRSKDMAFQSLFKQWNLPLRINTGINACQQAQLNGLRCLSASGNLNKLIQLNKPVILKFFDEKGNEFYAVLISYDGKTATVEVDNQMKKVDSKEIEKYWYGDYVLLWTPPKNFNINIRPGYKGPEVDWLDRQLSLIQGRKPKAVKSLVYNKELVNYMKKFQLSKGFIPDGVVGPHTLILLSNASGNNGPALNRKVEDK